MIDSSPILSNQWETDMSKLKQAILVAVASIVFATGAEASGQKILSMVTATDTEAQAMALVLANEAQAAGNDVQVLFCGAAGDVTLKTPPDAAKKVVTPTGMTVRTLLGGLLKKGGRADVCAIYLPNRKLQQTDLMEGVGVAKPKDIAGLMADPNVRVIGN